MTRSPRNPTSCRTTCSQAASRTRRSPQARTGSAARCASAGRSTSISKARSRSPFRARTTCWSIPRPSIRARCRRSSPTCSTCRRRPSRSRCAAWAAPSAARRAQAAQWAALAALAARITGRPCKIRLDRDDDMTMTGKRHDFRADYTVGFDGRGPPCGVRRDARVALRLFGGSVRAINDRAMFHADNAYYLPAARIVTKRMKTNTVSNTAFRGFGGPQGMMVAERLIDDIAWSLGLDPLDVRKRNLYGEGRDVTPYGMRVEDNILPELIETLERTTDYRARRPRSREFNTTSPLPQARARADAGQVRHLVHHHASQSGRRAGARLSGRLDPPEPRRHRDGAGAVRQGRAGGGRGIRRSTSTAREDHRDHDRRRSRTRRRPRRRRAPTSTAWRRERRRHDQGAADRVCGGEVCDSAATRSSSATTRCSSAIGAVPFARARPRGLFRRASRSPRPASTGRRRFTGTGQGERPAVLLFRLWRGLLGGDRRHDDRRDEGRRASTSSTTSAARSIRRSTSARSKAASCRAWAGSPPRSWSSIRTDGCSPTRRRPTRFPAPPTCRRISASRCSIGANREDTIYRSKAVGEPPLMLAISVFAAIADAIHSLEPGERVPLDAPATPESILRAVQEVTQD